MPSVTSFLSAGVLTVDGTVGGVNRIFLTLNTAQNQIIVSDGGNSATAYDNAAVTSIMIDALGRSNYVLVDQAVTQTDTIRGGPGANVLIAGGGPTTLISANGNNRLVGGSGTDTFDVQAGYNVTFGGSSFTTVSADDRNSAARCLCNTTLQVSADNPLLSLTGQNRYYGFSNTETITGATTSDRGFLGATAPPNLTNTMGLTPSPDVTITSSEVGTLLQRAAAATSSDDGIVAIVDRGGRLLGVRVEKNVSTAITGNLQNLVFAIDGAIAEARTGAFFGNNQAPLTSRTIEYISQTTVTQREVESNPSITSASSTVKGPGTVAPIGIGGHFPPNVADTPQVDLFGIENTNRDTTLQPVYDASGNIIGFNPLGERFNVNAAYIPDYIKADDETLAPPDSYGYISGLEPDAQPRGIGTLPGGIPIYKDGVVVGGIGVFFPGTTGYADAENSALSSDYNPNERDRAEEAEYVAFAALGGSSSAGFKIGTLGSIAALPGFDLPSGRIDLVGITLPVFGPDGTNGPGDLVKFGSQLGIGDPNSGSNQTLGDGQFLRDGTLVPEGWLVLPHDGDGITAAQVDQIITQGVQTALQTRAAIRLPISVSTQMVFAVSDKDGNIVGLFRMPDSTVFSIDVAVAKARNTAYYANADEVQAIDQPAGVKPGDALTNRTFRFLAEPYYPEGIDGTPPGPFSILNVGGVNMQTGMNVGAPLPASAYFNNVYGHDVFFAETNFHDPYDTANQNGIVFFPGSVPIYSGGKLIGGFGVSGDGVDQDDVVTYGGRQGFAAPGNVTTADEIFVNGIRLPYQKFNRQPSLS